MNNKEKRILQSWVLSEALSMPKIDKDKVKFYSSEEMLNWEKNVRKSCGFRVSLGLCAMKKILEYIRDVFESNEEFHQFSNEKTFMATITVTNEGFYQVGSLEITYFACFLGKIKAKKKDDIYKNLSCYFETITQELNVLFDQEFRAKKLDMPKIKEMQKLLEKHLNWPEEIFLLKEEGYIFDITVEALSNQKTPSFMNSFYLKDLQKILESEVFSSPLLSYLNCSSQKRIDVDENKAELEKWVHPTQIPNARWPAPPHFKLSLMQQVAVNIILSGESNIDSVNGPPGTGKTTLLKDVFADILFKRAKQMITFKNPLDAFIPLEYNVQTQKSKITPYNVAENIKYHSIIVASSNNSAVENISKELPQKKEVMRVRNNEFSQVEQQFEDEIYKLTADLNYFRNVATVLMYDKYDLDDEELETGPWGLFSATLGNAKNIEKFENSFWFGSKDQPNRMVDELTNHTYTQRDWENAKEELLIIEERIESKKKELSNFVEELLEYEKAKGQFNKNVKEIDDIYVELKKFETERELLDSESLQLQRILESTPRIGIWKSLTKKGREIQKEYDYYQQKNNEVVKKIYHLDTKVRKIKQELKTKEEVQKTLEQKQITLKGKFEKLREKGIIVPDSEFWKKDNYNKRQKEVPWISVELNHLRSQAFIAAMKVHKIFLSLASKRVTKNLAILFNRRSIDTNFKQNNEAIKLGWQTLFLIVPVISTTFASVNRFLERFDAGEIGHLFIDEAGQAVPQAAAGAIWRSKHVVAVGDPLQIEPVVTLPETLLRDIREYYEVDEAFMSLNSSVQSVADLANNKGKWKTDQQWIGIPLWVHRRCHNPMFTISNKIAYDDRMVLFREQESKNSCWIDVSGKAIKNQYVKEEGLIVVEAIIKMFKERKSIDELPSIYIITPFAAVKDELKNLLYKNVSQFQKLTNKPIQQLREWVNGSVGTVHTFQGKEAETVFFVIGTDSTQQGAASWIVSKPNLVNVAVTRAKKNFIVVGDYDRFSKMDIFDTACEYLPRLNGSM
ncbi:hypothetical protein BKP35_09040 [Anaerobacillus arseniciselenatis]|uniref:DNA2/NAM7 helicase-like C-terminal domain-containing protein n=1 Tax=Anaerobacillus arseniciselenatis TaxID=85682 RepID=A0A1S2LMD6_9BACI|nr:DEAD/DEAH box helicase [Anaerobacillus arseniciselenatis]OIJ13370.1 hypothetical protein BKP35_09040 [Anaerobacillus arseniciselenatis]